MRRETNVKVLITICKCVYSVAFFRHEAAFQDVPSMRTPGTLGPSEGLSL